LQALLFYSLCLASADTIQLKDQATVTGKILTEKPDSVAVDVGYTVLVVPRSAIASISKTSDVATQATAAAGLLLNVNAPAQFYYTDARPAAAHDVQNLVKQIGEAVVQVRTPSGLGSGFFINADGI